MNMKEAKGKWIKNDMADFNWCRHTPISLTHVRGQKLRPVAAMLILSNDLSDIVVGTNHGRNSWPRTLGCISQKTFAVARVCCSRAGFTNCSLSKDAQERLQSRGSTCGRRVKFGEFKKKTSAVNEARGCAPRLLLAFFLNSQNFVS